MTYSRASGERMQILIVDDQQAMRGALELLFDVHGLPAVSAGSPASALELIRSEDIGLVIQDMNFAEGETSGAGGLALFRAIRALDPELPVLLMTAWTSLETAVLLMREGAADYIAKPWNDDQVAGDGQEPAAAARARARQRAAAIACRACAARDRCAAQPGQLGLRQRRHARAGDAGGQGRTVGCARADHRP